MKITTCLMLTLMMAGACGGAWADDRPNNPFGAHTFIHDHMSPDAVERHLTWVHTMTGDWGYAKSFFYNITPETIGPQPPWVRYVESCYRHKLIPVIRLGGHGEGGCWAKPFEDRPGRYWSMAAAVQAVVEGLPRSDEAPLYVEIWNEPNNNGEWSWEANPAEYARFFVQVAKAIRRIGDPRIKIMNAGLSPGGDYNNLDFIDAMFEAEPGLGEYLDAWATHPYAYEPPEVNFHSRRLPEKAMTIDLYIPELRRLAKHMDVSNLKIIATEGGLNAATEDERASLTLRAFRDWWTKWPEVLAICPWAFSSPGRSAGADWVDWDSETDERGWPTKRYPIYDYIALLAEPGESVGTVSGAVTENVGETPLAGATVTLLPGGRTATTDTAGTYMFPALTPGEYRLRAAKQGFASASATVTVTAADNMAEDFTLTALGHGAIEGTARDGRTNAPLAGVRITAGPGRHRTVSDEQGRYRFDRLPPATYTITARKRGFYSDQVPGLVLAADQTLTAEVFLGPGGHPSTRSLIPGQGLDRPAPEGWKGVAEGWTPVTPEQGGHSFGVDHDVKYSGSGSQRICAGSAGEGHVWSISGYSAVHEGQDYLVQVWVRTADLPASAKGAHLHIVWHQNDMRQVGEADGPMVTGTTDWTLTEMRVTAPKDAGRLRVDLALESTSGCAWFDNVYAGKVPRR